MDPFSPFDRCILLLTEASALADLIADDMSDGREFADLLSEALNMGRKDVWPLTDEQRSENAKDAAADWRFERDRTEG